MRFLGGEILIFLEREQNYNLYGLSTKSIITYKKKTIWTCTKNMRSECTQLVQ